MPLARLHQVRFAKNLFNFEDQAKVALYFLCQYFKTQGLATASAEQRSAWLDTQGLATASAEQHSAWPDTQGLATASAEQHSAWLETQGLATASAEQR